MVESDTTFLVERKMDQLLERLKTQYGFSSKADVLRKAVALLELAIDAEQQGGQIVLKSGDKETRIVIR